jgi:hypothetical protein
MTTFNSSKAAATALRLIARENLNATLIKRVEGAYDPATGTNSITDPNYTVKSALLNFKANETNKPDSLIKSTDRKILIQATTVTPDTSDIITCSGTTYRIIAVRTCNPAGVDIFHELQARV